MTQSYVVVKVQNLLRFLCLFAAKSCAYKCKLLLCFYEGCPIFLYGFSKNEKANIDASELAYFKKLGRDLLSLDADQLNKSVEQQMLLDLEVE